ncbi:hypothetical protein FACS189449_04260 [Alphaproteobacteria bacterium]|nr:hypothetical protein FACS189449_04260 [Alphaproteobacteria bacterium]
MITRCCSFVVAAFLVVFSHPSVEAKGDARSVRNKLFKCHLTNKSHDKIYHKILDDIKLDKTRNIAIPGIALCSVKRTKRTSKTDREMFIKAIAAVSNYVNQIIMEHRSFVIMVSKKMKAKIALTNSEQQTFDMICSFYQSENIDELLRRVVPVPSSLTVAQASLESGFGSHSAIHRKNAFFGMMQNSRKLLAFDTLLESVVAYTKTLNVNPCYKNFRKIRRKMLDGSQKIDGAKLSKALGQYAKSRNYNDQLQRLIREYNLATLDRVYS